MEPRQTRMVGTIIMYHFESEDEPGQTAWYEGEIVAYIGDKGDEDENGELLNFDV